MHYYTSYMLLFYLIFAPSLDLSLSLSFILLILAVAVEPISSEKNDIYLCTFRTHTKRHFLPPSCVPCCSFYFGTSIQTLRVIFIVCTLLLHCSVFLQIVTSIYVCVARVCVCVSVVCMKMGWLGREQASIWPRRNWDVRECLFVVVVNSSLGWECACSIDRIRGTSNECLFHMPRGTRKHREKCDYPSAKTTNNNNKK